MSEEAAVAAIGGIFALFGIAFTVFWFIGAAIGILGMVFWILMIVDVVNRKFKKEDEKTVWIIIVVLTGVIGAIIYYFMIKSKDKK